MRNMLTLTDREEISRGLAEGMEYQEIARLLDRNPSVVSRGVARHGGRAQYRAVIADGEIVEACRQPDDNNGEFVVGRTLTAPARHHTKIIP